MSIVIDSGLLLVRLVDNLLSPDKKSNYLDFSIKKSINKSKNSSIHKSMHKSIHK